MTKASDDSVTIMLYFTEHGNFVIEFPNSPKSIREIEKRAVGKCFCNVRGFKSTFDFIIRTRHSNGEY